MGTMVSLIQWRAGNIPFGQLYEKKRFHNLKEIMTYLGVKNFNEHLTLG